MNPVNLLPAKHRPRTPTGGQQGSSYIVIGVLGALLLMVLAYAVTVNGINGKKASVARTKAETAQAQKRVAELGPYGNFTQVKEQRVSSVKSLATGRIDWERLARGLAHVLPQDVWLLSASAASSGDDNASGPAAPPPAAAPPAPAPGGDKPTAAPTPDPKAAADAAPRMTLKACAPSHSEIAVTLVRLRHLPNVKEVSLVSATKPQSLPTSPDAAATGGAAPAAGGPGGGGGDEDCGTIKKRPAFTFETLVTFKPLAGSDVQPGAEKHKVPTGLGGGA